jgi:hypothetical protein
MSIHGWRKKKGTKKEKVLPRIFIFLFCNRVRCKPVGPRRGALGGVDRQSCIQLKAYKHCFASRPVSLPPPQTRWRLYGELFRKLEA